MAEHASINVLTSRYGGLHMCIRGFFTAPLKGLLVVEPAILTGRFFFPFAWFIRCAQLLTGRSQANMEM